MNKRCQVQKSSLRLFAHEKLLDNLCCLILNDVAALWNKCPHFYKSARIFPFDVEMVLKDEFTRENLCLSRNQDWSSR